MILYDLYSRDHCGSTWRLPYKLLQEGDTITAAHLVTARPALGIHPRYMDALIGTKQPVGDAAGTLVRPRWVAT